MRFQNLQHRRLHIERVNHATRTHGALQFKGEPAVAATDFGHARAGRDADFRHDFRRIVPTQAFVNTQNRGFVGIEKFGHGEGYLIRHSERSEART